MHRQVLSRDWRRTGQVAGASLTLVLLLFLNAAAVSCDLHALVCADADQPTHQCPITKFAGGMVESTPLFLACEVPLLTLLIAPLGPAKFCPRRPLFRLSPSRAPPV
jgi:hypothetical protein